MALSSKAYSLTVASKWSKGVAPGDIELVRTVSKVYGIEEENTFTELGPTPSPKAMCRKC